MEIKINTIKAISKTDETGTYLRKWSLEKNNHLILYIYTIYLFSNF